MDKINHNHYNAQESPNHFIIKYKDETYRKKLVDFILDLVKKYELKNFHIEEFKAFTQEKIIYNTHTIFNSKNINDNSATEIENNFLKVFKN